MRTTLTLDDDVAAALERLRRTRKTGFKALVNEVLREGLKQVRAQPTRREPLRTQRVDLGRLRIGSVDNVGETLAIAGGDLSIMTLVDANLLIYAHVTSLPQHERARAWLDCEVAWIPQPGERHAQLLGELLAVPGIHANLVSDAHLAALAMEHGLILYSTDSDFVRFPRLRWTNPLNA